MSDTHYAGKNQRKYLYLHTRLHWYKPTGDPTKSLDIDITAPDASTLLTSIWAFLKGDKSGSAKILDLVYKHARTQAQAAKWDLSDLRPAYSKKGKGKGKGKSKETGAEPEPEPDIADLDAVADQLAEPPEPPKPEPEPEPSSNMSDLDKLDALLSGDLDKLTIGDLTTIATICKDRLDSIKAAAHSEPTLPVFNPADSDYIKPECFDKVTALVRAGLNVWLAGPAGCGKTLLARKVAEVLGRECFIHSCAGNQGRKQLVGKDDLVIEDGKQKSSFTPSDVLTSICSENRVTVLDEWPTLEPDAAVAFNGLLERNTREIKAGGFTWKRPASSAIIATGNTAGMGLDRKHAAAQIQDGSNKDRFVTIFMTYDSRVDTEIVNQYGMPEGVTILQRMNSLRERCKAEQIPFDASTRRLVSALDAMRAGLSADDAFEVAFLADFNSMI